MLRSALACSILMAAAAPVVGQDGTILALMPSKSVQRANGAGGKAVLDLPARLTIEDVSLHEALEALRDRAGAPVAFSPTRVRGQGPVSCVCEELTVGEALEVILSGTDFHFTVVGERVLIERRDVVAQLASGSGAVPAQLVLPRPLSLNQPMRVGHRMSSRIVRVGVIEGRVMDSGGQPLSGTQVEVVGSGLGTLTDAQGRFRIDGVPAGEVEIQVQRIGFATLSRTVSVRAGETVSLELQLAIAPLGLDQIIVTGQAGQARRREVGTTIGEIQVGELPEPIPTVAGVLRGRVSGMTVTQGTSQLGSGQAVRLRGNVSVSRSNQPLVYIDGIRQAADHLPRPQALGMQFSGTNTHPSALESLNVADIERIEVVKGAAAATLYGSEAAAGVVQIFTKRGAQGAPRWTYQTNQTLSRVQKFGSDERPYLNMDPFLKTAYGQQHSLSVSGGSEQVRYFFSGGVEGRDGPRGIDEQTKYNLRGNLNVQLWDGVELQWNTAYSDDELRLTHTGANLWGLEFNAFRAPNNTVGSADPEVIGRLLDGHIDLQNRRFNTGATLRYTPMPRFSHRLILGLDRYMAEIRQLLPYGYILNSQGLIDERFWTRQGLTLEYVGTYGFDLSPDLRSSLSWGGQWITTNETDLQGFGVGLPGPGEHTLASTAVRQTSSSQTRVVDAGVFLQTAFDYLDRYFLTIGARIDGNSTFGDDFGLQFYPKISASYVVSDEAFWPEAWGHLRVRAAFGQAGRAPGPFDAVRTWAPFSFAGQTAFLPSNLGDPDLGPERSTEIEVGFEASLLDERLQIEVTGYRQRTSEALMLVEGDPSLGFVAGQLENVGTLKNRGFELEVNGIVLESPAFTWRLGASIATHTNEVLDTGDQTFANIIVGHPAPVRRGTRVLNPDEFAEPVVEQNAILGPTQPTRIVGLNSRLEIGNGIGLSARGEYHGGHYVPSAMEALVNRGNGAPYCDPSMSGAYGHVPYDEWSADHPGLAQVNALDRARCYRETQLPGVWNLRGDFFKIRDLTLSVPVGYLVRPASSALLSLSVSNIRVWTKDYHALDPETSTRVTAGEGVLDTTFGEGGGNFTPAPMVWTMGLRITF